VLGRRVIAPPKQSGAGNVVQVVHLNLPHYHPLSIGVVWWGGAGASAATGANIAIDPYRMEIDPERMKCQHRL